MASRTEKYKALLPAHLSDREKEIIISEILPLAELTVNEFFKGGVRYEAQKLRDLLPRVH